MDILNSYTILLIGINIFKNKSVITSPNEGVLGFH